MGICPSRASQKEPYSSAPGGPEFLGSCSCHVPTSATHPSLQRFGFSPILLWWFVPATTPALIVSFSHCLSRAAQEKNDHLDPPCQTPMYKVFQEGLVFIVLIFRDCSRSLSLYFCNYRWQGVSFQNKAASSCKWLAGSFLSFKSERAISFQWQIAAEVITSMFRRAI